MTKAEIYTYLVAEGVKRKYRVIPEFDLPISGNKKPVHIDLVWALPRSNMPKSQDRSNLEYWQIVGAFEIEGCNVPHSRIKQHSNRAEQVNGGNAIFLIDVVLYTETFDRTNYIAWNESANVKGYKWIAERMERHNNDFLKVQDGRNFDWLLSRF